jgi:ABC-2 type transport system permease protein
MTLNRIGMFTLLRKEVARFSKVWMQTVLSPLVTTALYFLVFGVALGSRLASVPVGDTEVRYIEFVVPGLMMLAMINNSFLNSASSLFQSKINGTITDLLTTPLGTPEILFAYVAGAVIRGMLVGGLVWLTASVFVGFSIHSPIELLAMSVLVTATFGLLGLCAAVVSEKFDQLNIIPSFVLTPLTFLGGVFYSAAMLPEPWSTIVRFNPIFHMVGGIRHALIGASDTSIAISWLWVAGTMLISMVLTWRLFGRGTRLRT